MTDDMDLDDDITEGTDPEDMSLDSTTFDLDDEYKEDPLAPMGTYNGVVKAVEYVGKIHALVWTVVAVSNIGLVMVDGEMPVDGVDFQYNCWLPRPGDENIRSSNGKSNKRQTKINMLKQFQTEMDVDMNTPEKVAAAIEEQEWVGIPVIFKLSINTYKGKTRNQIDNMHRSEEDFELPDCEDDC